MSKRSRRSRVLQVDPDASEDFFISASDALRNGRASSTPAGTGQSVSLEEATADRRRIHRETVPVPTPTAAAATTSTDANHFSPDSLPYTLQSIPDWDTFFQPQEPSQEDASAVLEEHARRYLNSVSRVHMSMRSGRLTRIVGCSHANLASRTGPVPRRARSTGRARGLRS